MKVPWKTIAEAWVYFQNRVIHTDAPQIQKDEMRKAFFAGASSCFDLMMDISDLPQSDVELKMSELHEEFSNYGKMLKANLPKNLQ